MMLGVTYPGDNIEQFSQLIREHGPGESWISAPWFVASALIAMGLGLAIWLIARAVQQDRRRHGAALRRLCAAEAVGMSDRRLLTRMAHAAGILSPAALMVSQGCFDIAAGRFLDHDQAARDRVERLRQTLFD